MDLNALFAHTRWVRALSMDLLGDAQRAEDVVQETFMSALQQPGSADWSAGRMRAWLAQVARNSARMFQRGESRRRAREALRASPEAQPSASQSLELLELQQKIAAAVIALGSPDREIIVLRYFDDLPPRQIAHNLGMSPSAVYSRLSRARAVLRERLEGEYGASDKRWSVVALAWVSRPSVDKWALPGAVAGGLLVKTIVITAVSTIVLLALLGWGWFRPMTVAGQLEEVSADAQLAPLQRSGDEPVPLAAPDAGRPTEHRVALETQPSEPVTAPAVPVPTTGTVRVLVVGRDGLAAVGVGLNLHSWVAPEAWFHEQRKTTDAEGIAEFTTGAGEVIVYLRRLSHDDSFAAERVQVVAGETCEVTFEVADGTTIRGRVVDYSGRAIEGADVWLGDGNGPPHDGQVVTRSGRDGSFEIRHAGGLQAVAARAPGYAPSPAFLPLIFGDGEAAEPFIELVLPDLGGAIEGEVLDAAGNPRANALVLVGNAEFGRVLKIGDRPAYDPPLVRVRTDAAGRFRVDGVAAGLVRVRARAQGSDLAEIEVQVPRGGVGFARIVVGAAARVAGVVRRADGRTVTGARIALEHDVDGLTRTHTTSDETGYFELEGIPVGRVVLIAELDSEGLAVRTELETRAEREEWWEAYFPDAATLTGVVMDEDGYPLAGWYVRRETVGVEEAEGNMAKGLEITDTGGTFRFDGCPDAPQTLTVRPPGQWFLSPVGRLDGVVPGRDAVTIRVAMDAVPPGAFRGLVVDADGQAIGGAQVEVEALTPTFVHFTVETAPDGRFQAEHLPPSNYTLSITADGFVLLALDEPNAFQEGDQRDLGQLELKRAD